MYNRLPSWRRVGLADYRWSDLLVALAETSGQREALVLHVDGTPNK
jgi:hypothetical protein